MPKLVPDFLKRLKEQTIDRATNRFWQDMSPEVAPPGTDTRVPEEEQLPQGFGDRLKRTVRDKLQNFSPIQRRMLDPNVPLDPPTLKYRIKYAGENRLLLWMMYNNQRRFVEPYSYRYDGKKGEPKTLRFFGYCRIHDRIHNFKVDRIQALIVTSETFQPRWPIEVA